MRSFKKVLNWLTENFSDKLLSTYVEVKAEFSDERVYSARMFFERFKAMVDEANGMEGFLKAWLGEDAEKLKTLEVSFAVLSPLNDKFELVYTVLTNAPLSPIKVEKLLLTDVRLELISTSEEGIDYFLDKAKAVLDIQQEVNERWLK